MRNILPFLLIFLMYASAFARNTGISKPEDPETGTSEISVSGRELIQENQAPFTAILKSATRLFADKEDLTSVIFVIPAETEVDVLGADSMYLRVVYEDTEGFILKRHAQIRQTPFSSRTSIMPYTSGDQTEIRSLPQTDARAQQSQTQAPPQTRIQDQTQAPPQVRIQDQTQPSLQPQPQEESRFSYLENKYGTDMAVRLAAGKIWKGMDSEMVLDSWGKPLNINRVISDNSVREEWIYKNAWLYIRDDMLLTWGPVRK